MSHTIVTFYIIKHRKKKDSDTTKYNESVKEKSDFDEKPSVDGRFEEKIVMDILNNILYDLIKTEEPYVEPTVQDPETTDDRIKQENEDYLQTAAEFNRIDMGTTAHKKATFTAIFLMSQLIYLILGKLLTTHLQQKIFLLITICLVKMTLKMTICK